MSQHQTDVSSIIRASQELLPPLTTSKVQVIPEAGPFFTITYFNTTLIKRRILSTGLMLSNTDYSICIRSERSFCGIQYTTCANASEWISTNLYDFLLPNNFWTYIIAAYFWNATWKSLLLKDVGMAEWIHCCLNVSLLFQILSLRTRVSTLSYFYLNYWKQSSIQFKLWATNYTNEDFSAFQLNTPSISMAFSITGSTQLMGSVVGTNCATDWIQIPCATNTMDVMLQIGTPGKLSIKR